MKTIIIGLGNPILSDDGVGWKVAEKISEQLLALSKVEGSAISDQSVNVETASLGGLSLMERMVGYERVILIDSMETGQSPIGSVRVFALDELANPSAGHSASAHDTSLMTALETGRSMGLAVPREVQVVAIEAAQVYDFSEELSPAVADAVPLAVQSVIQLLKEEP
jgi:hydrogenase maturation protease